MNIISLGAGIQSTAMLLMANRGELMRPEVIDFDGEAIATGKMVPWEVDCAIFADTGWEPKSVYVHLENLIRAVDIPVYIVSVGNIKNDLIEKYTGKPKRFASIPFFVKNTDGSQGMVRRQCSSEYKIEAVSKESRRLMGLKPRQRSVHNSVNMLLGITTDEISRVKPSSNRMTVNQYPFIDMRMSRIDCMKWLRRNKWGEVAKSACIGCPYRSDVQWQDMKDNDPESFAEAVEIDKLLRSGVKNPQWQHYMHRSLKPLDEVVFSDKSQTNLFDMECEGMCGV